MNTIRSSLQVYTVQEGLPHIKQRSNLEFSREDVKSAMGPYCREYKSIVWFFSPGLPNCSYTNFVSLYTLWACNGRYEAFSVYYTPKVCITRHTIWSTIVFLRKMNWARGRQERKRSRQYCYATIGAIAELTYSVFHHRYSLFLTNTINAVHINTHLWLGFQKRKEKRYQNFFYASFYK